MPRILFEKTGTAIWISHLDLMRLFQRAFKRAGLPLTHTRGFNPRPSVSIALPLSVGIESRCELLDFELEGAGVSCAEIRQRLNQALIAGVRVLDVYEDGKKIRELALLRCRLRLEYDAGIPSGAEAAVVRLFERPSLPVEKKGKNGVVEQDILPMIRRLSVSSEQDGVLTICSLVQCQNPSLNPMQLAAAIERYLPEYKPDFVTCSREEIYTVDETIFR